MIGQVTAGGAQGILVAEQFVGEYQQIMDDPSLCPDERLHKLTVFIGKVSLSAGMIYLNMKGTKQDLVNINRGKTNKTINDFADMGATIEHKPVDAIEVHADTTVDTPHKTTVQEEPLRHRIRDEGSAHAVEPHGKTEEVTAKKTESDSDAHVNAKKVDLNSKETIAKDKEHVSKLSDEAANAEKNGNYKLRDQKITEARSYLREKVLDNPNILPEDKPAALIDRLDVSSPKDGAIFWSGNKDNAKLLASEVDGVCLETTKGGRIIDDWNELGDDFPGWAEDPSPNEFDLWGGVSKKYASQTSGKVRVIQTSSRAPDGGFVWQNAEKETLNDLMEEGIVSEIEFMVKD